MLCRAKASSVSQVGLDAVTIVVLFFVTGGVSFCSGVDRARGSYGEPKVTPPSLVYTPSDLTSLASVIRGTGNMAVPAVVTSVGAATLIPLSPCLIFGWGLFPRLGVAGGAVAVIAFYVAGSVALVAYLRTGRSVVRLSFADVRFRWPLFRDILRVGAVAALITVQTNLTIAIAT